MADEIQRLTFTAELEAEGAETVRFRYLIDDSAGIVMRRDWWEQMGHPTSITVTVERESSG